MEMSLLKTLLFVVGLACVISLPAQETRKEYSDDNNDVQKAIIAYSWVLTKVLALSSNPIVGAGATAIEHFTDVIIKMTANRDQSMWANIQERLDTRIDDKITTNHFGTLVHLVQKLQKYMKYGNGLTKKDLDVHIMTMKSQFQPQTFAYTSFNSKWTTAFPAFLTYMTAAHLQLMKDGKIDQCSLAKELRVIREETIESAKALARARYKGLVGIESFKKFPEGCTGAPCYHALWLKYKDSTTGKEYTELLSDVNGIFNTIEDHTFKIVWDQLVSKVNAFFDNTNASCGKLYPKPITMEEIEFRYPTECYGTSEDGKKQCTLPCHAYGDGYDWCPIFPGPIPSNNLLFNYWDYCKKDQGFLQCMPVKGTTIFDD